MSLFGALKITSTVLKPESHKILAPVLVIISGNSLAFSRKIIISTDFYWYWVPTRQHQ